MEAARAMQAGENADGETNLAVRPKRTDTKTLTSGAEPDKNEDYKPQNTEGPEYWKMHIMKMKETGDYDEPVDHPMNLDWALTHEKLDKQYTQLKLQPAFIPRRGELVLWAPKIDGPLVYNPDKLSFMIKKGNTWVFPEWRAGVITKLPKTDQSFLDIIKPSIEETDDTDDEAPPDPRAFRVETIPDPLAPSKDSVVEHEFVPLQCIKPFNTYARYIYGIPQKEVHPSIPFAMTTMASYSVVSNVRFSGTWPNARIHSQGMFVGNELVALHDTIRLKPYGLTLDDLEQGNHGFPEGYDPVDVMVIEDIWLELINCNDDPKDPKIAELIMPRLAGKVYTRQHRRLDYPIPFGTDPLVKLSNDEVSSAFHQIGMSGYGDWYSVAGGKSCAISPAMSLGRCYEPEAATLGFGTRKLDYDMHGVLNGRHYSCLVDSRTTKPGDWFWGDCRVETLGLSTVNGADVGLGAPQRQPPKRWHAIFRIVNGEAYGDTEIRDAGLNRGAGRPPKELEQYMSSSLVASGVGPSGSTTPEGVIQESEEVDSEAGLTPSELAADFPYRKEESLKEAAEEEYSEEPEDYEYFVDGDSHESVR